jgi:hypothetical protein
MAAGAMIVLVWGACAWASSPLLLNQATAEDFAALPGVGQSVAERIVAMRTERGKLGSVEELRLLGLAGPALAAIRAAASVEVELQVQTEASFDDPAAVLAHFAKEPTVQQVQAWTNTYSGTHPDEVRHWMAASRAFAALPQLTLEYRLRDGWDQDFLYLTQAGSLASSPSDEVEPVFEDGGRDQDAYYTVRARWDLQELVMSYERIRIIDQAQDIVKLRDKLLTEVTRLYFERRKLQVETLLAPRSDVLGQVKDELRLMELTANLDALTGGAFSGGFARSGG